MESNTSEIIKKTFSLKNIKVENGEFLIWNMPCFVMPLNTYVLLDKDGFDNFGKNYKDLIYVTAKSQAIGGMQILSKQFGYKDIDEVVKLELQTSSLIGLGVVTYLKYDKKNKNAIMKIDPNPYAQQYKKVFGRSKIEICDWLRGAIAGILSYAWQTDISGVETKCSAMGNTEACIMEFRQKEEFKSTPSRSQLCAMNEDFEFLAKKQTPKLLRK